MDKLKVIIGRSPQCDYLIDNIEQHGTVSGSHATLSETESPDIFLFEDHSTNGSYVNGQYIRNGSIKVGVNARITLGKTYVLPLEDIIRRFFSQSKTTKKKPQNLSQQNDTYLTTPASFPESDNQKLLKMSGMYASSDKPMEMSTLNSMPKWYWAVLAGVFVVGILVGFIIAKF